MRILLVGAGGVGDAIAKIAARRDFFELIVVSDYDVSRAERTIAWIAAKHGDQGGRFVASKIDASDPESRRRRRARARGDPRHERRRAEVRADDLRRGARRRGRLPRHGDEPLGAASRQSATPRPV